MQRTWTSRAAWFLLAIWLFAASGARADADTARFDRLVVEAAEAYGAGEFQRSIERLREAYALEKNPRLLHNIGRAEEALGHDRAAIEAYRSYLEQQPDAEQAAVVEGRIRLLERRLTERERERISDIRRKAEAFEREGKRAEAIASYEKYLAAAPAATDVADVRSRLQRLKSGNDRTRSKPTTGRRSALPWVVMGSGAAGLAAGSVMGLLSRRRYDDASDRTRSGREARELDESGDRWSTAANVTWAISGAVLAAGIVWLFFETDTSSGAEKRVSQ